MFSEEESSFYETQKKQVRRKATSWTNQRARDIPSPSLTVGFVTAGIWQTENGADVQQRCVSGHSNQRAEYPGKTCAKTKEDKPKIGYQVGKASFKERLSLLFDYYLTVVVMNLHSTFSIYLFKCALQRVDPWMRSDINVYRRRWQLLSAIGDFT